MTGLAALFPSLDHVDEQGVRRASLVFSINLFSNVSFGSMPAALLRCQELFLEHCPRSSLRFYATENMRKHRAINAKAFGLLKQPGEDGLLALELKDGDDARDAPKFLFKVFGRDDMPNVPNMLSMAFPPEFGVERPAAMAELVSALAELVPLQSGSAGSATSALAMSRSAARRSPCRSRCVTRNSTSPELCRTGTRSTAMR